MQLRKCHTGAFLTLKVCLVGWILGRMKKKKEKMRRENFLESVWLEEGEKNVSWSQVCSPKSSLQNGEKTEWGEFDR